MLRRLPVASLVVLLALGAPERAQESADHQLLAQEAFGTVEVTEEGLLSISGLTGKLAVYTGAAGSITFESRSAGAGYAPLPIAVWLEGAGFRLAPAPGSEKRPVSLSVQVPPGMAVAFDVSDAQVTASGLQGDLLVRGARLDVSVEQGTRAAVLELEGSTARVARSSGSLSVRSRESTTTITAWTGAIALDTRGGALSAHEVHEVDGQTQGTKVQLDGCQGEARLHATGGTVDAKNLLVGGAFHMDRARLTLEQGKGTIEVESDSEVRFNQVETLRVSGAGTLVGSRSTVALEVNADGASVSLDSLSGMAQISGSNLKLALRHIGSQSHLEVSSSEVTLDDVSGPLEIVSDDSNVKVSNASQEITIRSKGGDLQVLGQMGPATVHADGEHVQFEWGTLFPGKSSTIENEGGSVFMLVPAGSGMRIEAESRSGRVESQLSEIEVSPEGSKASGSLGRANASLVVRVVAERDVTLASRKSEE